MRMKYQPVRTDEDIEETINTYADSLYRICITMLKNPADAEDVVQETFIKYYQTEKQFDSPEHKKAWLITVTVNQCKNIISFFKRHPKESIDDSQKYIISSEINEDSDILDALLKLNKKYRIVLTLYYVEEYKVREIVQILGLHESTVKRRLQTGRKHLAKIYREEYLI